MTEKLKLQGGFTIIEFLIAITILGIITSLAVPVFAGLTESYRIDGNQRSLLSSLKYAQAEASKQNRAVSVCVAHATNADTCSTTTTDSWQQGWIVFLDEDANGVIASASNDILRRNNSVNRVRVWHSGSLRTVTFSPTGSILTGGGSFFRVCTLNSADQDCSGNPATASFSLLNSGQLLPKAS